MVRSFTYLFLSAAALQLVALGPTDAVAKAAYAGYWEPGSGTQWWLSGLTFEAFKTQDQTYFNQGLRHDRDIIKPLAHLLTLGVTFTICACSPVD